MKQIYLLLTSLFMMGSAATYGQDFLDIPLSTDGTKVNLYWWIAQDTTTAGERMSDNRVYRLERGGEYYMQSNEPFNFSFGMVANDDTSTGDGTGRPPVVFRGRFEGGVNVQKLFVLSGNNNHYYFENIIFSALDYDDAYETEWTSGFNFLGNNTRVEFKSCVFNAWQGGAVNLTGKDNIVYLSDNTFRNGVYINHPFGGQQGNFSQQPIDTLVVTNNTYINNSSFWLIQGNGSGGLADYVLFEHNTIMGSVVNTIFMREMVNAHYRSNIFYAEAVYGDNQQRRDDRWYTDDGSALATVYFTDIKGSKLADAGMTEADRVINVSHNTFFQPQAVTDFHAAYADITGGVFMNDVTKAMFNDDTAYPHLDMSNNVEVDPEFSNTEVDTYVSDRVTASAKSFYDTRGSGDWGVAPDRRNIDENLSNSGKIRLMDWPLVEGGLEITSSSLLTGGHDGLPVGNLNWSTSNRSSYQLPDGVGGMLGLNMFGAVGTPPTISDIEDVKAIVDAITNFRVDTSDDFDTSDNLILSFTDSNGDAVTSGFSSAYSSALGYHTVSIDANILTTGVYNVVATNTEGLSASRPVDITIDASGDLIANTQWPFINIGNKTSNFKKIYEFTPNGSAIDAKITMSDKYSTLLDDLSVIVRFKPDGTIDANNGLSFSSENSINYTSGTTYIITFYVYVSTNTYSVSIKEKGEYLSNNLAINYNFYDFASEINTVSFPAILWSYTYKDIDPTPTISDIEDVRAIVDAITNFRVDANDDTDTSDNIILSFTDSNGDAVNSGLSSTYSSVLGYHTVSIDANILTTGVYNVVATDTEGLSSYKPVDITIDASGDLIANTQWPFINIGSKTSSFKKTYEFTPNGSAIDAKITMSDKYSTLLDDLSVIVRFKPDGTIDANNGLSFSSENSINYTSGTTYIITFYVYVSTSTYSVSIKEKGEDLSNNLAINYNFYDFASEINTVSFPAMLWSYTYKDLDPTLELSDLETNFGIYPNPVIGSSFKLIFPSIGNRFHLQIIDLTGKEVFSTSLTKTEETVSISSGLSTGVYIIKLYSGTNVTSKKLIIK